jgi:Tol biopolymer transport system component
LAFLGDAPGGPDTANIYAINVDGTGVTSLAGQVTGKNVSVWTLVPPFFSPDSKEIAFVLSRSVPLQPVTYDMYVVNLDGTGLTRLTNNKNAEGIIAWAGP